MGTYLEFRQPDPGRIDETNRFLHSIRDPQGRCLAHLWDQEDRRIEQEKLDNTGYGYPDIYPLGAGQVKLSGDDYVESLYRPADLFRHLAEAVERFGLEVKLPTNADDYLDEDEISLFILLSGFQAEKEREEKERLEAMENKQAALSEMRKKVNGGLYLCKSWGHNLFWVIPGNVETPRFLQIEYQYGDTPAKELFRDREGRAYLLIPLMELPDKGKIRKALEYAWDNLGLRTDPNVLLIACYHFLPRELTIDGKKYRPTDQSVPYPDLDDEFVFVDDHKNLQVTKFSKEIAGLPPFILLKPVSRKEKRLYVSSHYQLGKIFEKTME